jgi:hypothetical protein
VLRSAVYPVRRIGMMVICCGMLGVIGEEDEGTDCEDGDSDTDW